MEYKGIIPPIVTPLNQDESLDEISFLKLVNHCIKSGVHGLFVMGTSGEGANVGKCTWRKTLELCLREAGERLPVFCGAIDISTARVIERIKEAEQLGAKAVVATPSFYIQNTSQDEIIKHYEKICNSTNLDVVVYNIPATTHVNILPETMFELGSFDNIVAYKDSCANWEQVQRDIFFLKGTRVSILNGAEELCGVSIIFGADGCVPGLANFFPRIFLELYEAGLNGRINEVYNIQKEIWEIRKMLTCVKSWLAAIKYIASKLGFGSEVVSSPIQPLSKNEKNNIDLVLNSYFTRINKGE
jgi:4-hydroxy-tetrahydrodipicolinate synthase